MENQFPENPVIGQMSNCGNFIYNDGQWVDVTPMSEDTNFGAVKRLNEVFGNFVTDNPAKIAKQLKLIHEEVEELTEAIENNDLHEIRDGIADILVVTYGMGAILGIPVDEDMKAVSKANFSKLCKDETELNATIQFYNDKGVEVYHEGTYPEVCVKSAKDQTGTDGKEYPAHKFLKNILWNQPVFMDNSSPLCCSTPEEARLTNEMYQELGIDIYAQHYSQPNDSEYVTMHSTSDQIDTFGVAYKKDQMLKCVKL